jgi:hypothetical protein
LDRDEAVWGEGLHTKVRKETWDVWTSALTASHQIGVKRVSRDAVKSETVYATMQPPAPPPAASTGADGVGSSSGVLEMMVKSSAKKSIGVIVSGVV